MNEKALFEYNDKNFYYSDVVSSLKKVGLKNGDVVFVHNDLGKFGLLADVKNRYDFNKAFLDACLEVIGEKGTLVIPNFTYSFCDDEVFDYNKSPSKIGYFSEMVRTTSGFRRSDDPIFSVSSNGPKTSMLIDNLSNQCFGKNSVFDRMYKINAKILNLGFYFYPTFIHFVEAQCKVPYRYDKIFSGIIKKNKKQYNTSYVYNVRNLELNPFPNISMLEKRSLKEKTVQRTQLGGGMITCVQAKDLFNIASKMIQKNPTSLVIFK